MEESGLLPSVVRHPEAFKGQRAYRSFGMIRSRCLRPLPLALRWVGREHFPIQRLLFEPQRLQFRGLRFAGLIEDLRLGADPIAHR